MKTEMMKKGKNSTRNNPEVLIVEDSLTQATQIKHLLESYHYKVSVSQNGKQAMDRLLKHKPSVVISDILMPEMNGYELCKKIKSNKNTEDIPVILLTRLIDPEEIIEGLSCGADSFITKPYNNKYLISSIEKILKEKATPETVRDTLGIEINYGGKKRLIRIGSQKVVKLLLNIYQGAINKNNELIQTQGELKLLNERLESMVEDRISDLSEEIKLSKQIANRLKESEERFRTLYNDAVVGLYRTNSQGKILLANRALVKMLGFQSFEELTKRNLKKTGYGPSYQRQQFIYQIEKEGEVKELEAIWICRDGKEIFVRENAKAIYDSDGKILYYDGSVEDITEQKRAAEDLNKIQHLFETLALVSPVGIFRTDQDGYTTYVNPKYLDLSGLSSEEAYGNGWLNAVHPDDRGKLSGIWLNDLKSKNESGAEYRFLKPDGRIIWVIGKAVPELIGNEITGYIGTITDITDRKLAEDRLRSSEERLKILFDYAPDAYYLNSLKGNFIDGNIAAEKLLGYDKNELIGKNFLKLNLLSLKQLTRVAKLLVKNSLGQATGPDEFVINRKDGSIVTAEIITHPVKIKDQTLVLGIARDISERKRAEKVLRESEEKYRRIFENVQDLYYETSIEGTILEVSPSIEFLSKGQYHRDELIGKSMYDFYSDTNERAALISQLKKKGTVSDFEITLKNRDGSRIPCSISSKICLDAQGRPEKIIGSMRDITDRKQAERELLKHRDHLEELINERTKELRAYMDETRDLYENAPCGYQSIDADGKYLRINNTELKWLGYTSDELLGKTGFADLLTPESLKTFKSTFPVFKKQGKLSNLEFEIIRKDGSTFFVSLNATGIYDADGKFLRSRSTLFDITERKVTEEKLNTAKKEAEEANKAKSEFLANMSHEIRTPMNAVLGYTELLGSTSVDQVQKDYINSIKSSGRSLLTLINDILDLSKIEAGKLEMEYDYVDTYSFFSEFERIFSLKVSEKGLKFILDITSGTPAGIYIDEARVRQIVFNLIGNAIKFTSEGKIIIKVFTENPRIVNYSKEKSEELIDLIIEVQDTGIGISKELQEAIFEPFFQERDSNKYGGTGLGLTITRRLTALMNGTIHVQSEPGKGSTFIVRIPEIAYLRDFSKISVDIHIDPAEIVFEKAVILIADDVEHNRSYLRDALKNTNLKIVEAEDGIAAYKLAKKIVPDLIIADIRMPKMDGFQFLDKIKTDNKLKHLPVIAYSASVLSGQKERIHKSEFAGLLIKPVKVTELYLELMNFLPFKSTRETEPDKALSEVDLIGEITNLSGLINSLETDFYAVWKTFAVRQPIGEIRDFGKNMIQLGMDHNSSIITGYGKELIGAADSFNIETILKLIGQYKGIIENLKDSTKNLNNG